MFEQKSAVAQLLQQIDQEYQAAQQALTGLASGIARHDFINAREERIAMLHQELASLVGKYEATRMVVEHCAKNDC